MLLAHLKWFEDPSSVVPLGISGLEWLLPLLIVGGGILFFLLVDKHSKNINLKVSTKLASWRPYVPSAVALTIGLSLVLYALGGKLFAPNLPVYSSWLLVLEFVVGLMLLLGLFTRWGAAGLLILYTISLFFVPLGSLAEHFEFVGAAVFLLIIGSGAWSFDKLFKISQPSTKKYQPYALPAYCFLTGLSLSILAFTEKLFNLNLAEEFLMTHHWNLLAIINVSNHWFIIFTGSFELLLGILIAFRIATRLAIAMLAGVMALTAVVLGPTEVAGHLFAIGLALAIWVGDERLSSNRASNKHHVKDHPVNTT